MNDVKKHMLVVISMLIQAKSRLLLGLTDFNLEYNNMRLSFVRYARKLDSFIVRKSDELSRIIIISMKILNFVRICRGGSACASLKEKSNHTRCHASCD